MYDINSPAGEPITEEQKRVINLAIHVAKTWADANDIGAAMVELYDAIEAMGYKGNYKEIF